MSWLPLSWLWSANSTEVHSDASTPTNTSLSSPEASRSKSPVDLLLEWEWVLSPAEELTEDRTRRQKEELAQLRKAVRPLDALRGRYKAEAEIILLSLPLSQRASLLQYLDRSKRYNLLRDVLDNYITRWVASVNDVIFKKDRLEVELESFIDNCKHAMVQIALGASDSSDGLTITIMGDILLSMWLSYTRHVAEVLSRSLLHDEAEMLAEQIGQCARDVVDAFLHMARISRLGTSREGRVVSQWKQQDVEEKARLRRIKDIDAKWEPPAESLVRGIDHDRFHLVSKSIENKLVSAGLLSSMG